METKSFLGLNGLNHFWEKAKIWIINEITAKIAGIVLNSVPTGTVLPFAGPNVPAGYFLCDGSSYLRTAYPELFAAIGTLYNLPTDGGEVFRVPDYREVALVGAGQSTKAGIATHDVYTLGEFKDDRIQSITGDCGRFASDGEGIYSGALYVYNHSGGGGWDRNGGNCSRMIGLDVSRVARTGSTTHGKQIGVNYIIKY